MYKEQLHMELLYKKQVSLVLLASLIVIGQATVMTKITLGDIVSTLMIALPLSHLQNRKLWHILLLNHNIGM